MFLDHTQRRTAVGRTRLDEWSARRRDLYLTHDTHNRQISMPPVGFEPTISAGERPDKYPCPPGAWIFVCCECRVLSGRGLCDELITRPDESYRLRCVVVCDLETSRMGAPYIYDISRLRDLYLTTHNTHNRQTFMPPGGIRTYDFSRRAAANLRLGPRGHWDRHREVIKPLI